MEHTNNKLITNSHTHRRNERLIRPTRRIRRTAVRTNLNPVTPRRHRDRARVISRVIPPHPRHRTRTTHIHPNTRLHRTRTRRNKRRRHNRRRIQLLRRTTHRRRRNSRGRHRWRGRIVVGDRDRGLEPSSVGALRTAVSGCGAHIELDPVVHCGVCGPLLSCCGHIKRDGLPAVPDR